MGSQRVWHDLATEQQQEIIQFNTILWCHIRIKYRHQSFITCNTEQCERCLNFRNRIQSPFLLGLRLYHFIALQSWNPPFLGLWAAASTLWGRGESVSGKKRADFQFSLYLQHMYLTTYEKFWGRIKTRDTSHQNWWSLSLYSLGRLSLEHWHSRLFLLSEYIQAIMVMEESVQHVVMTAIQEVRGPSCLQFVRN